MFFGMTLWIHSGEQKEKEEPFPSWCQCQHRQPSRRGDPVLHACCVTGDKLKYCVLSFESIESLDSLGHRKV